MNPMRFLALLLLVTTVTSAQTRILLNGHAHNDYTHKRPLLDALDNGFFSVEVDIFYENGNFIVAHTKAGINRRNTIQRLYLEPLKERVQANNGRVYPGGPLEFEVMIDLKGGWSKEQIDSLERLMMRYTELFTVFQDGVKEPRAIRLLLSGGNGNYDAPAHNPRYFSLDGGLGDFNSPLDSTIICRTSASFKSKFKWRGIGKMPEDEKARLKAYVEQAHASGRKIRFWAATNREKVWNELLLAGVDWVNVDKLSKFKNFTKP